MKIKKRLCVTKRTAAFAPTDVSYRAVRASLIDRYAEILERKLTVLSNDVPGVELSDKLASTVATLDASFAARLLAAAGVEADHAQVVKQALAGRPTVVDDPSTHYDVVAAAVDELINHRSSSSMKRLSALSERVAADLGVEFQSTMAQLVSEYAEAFEDRVATLEDNYCGDLEDPWDDDWFYDKLADGVRMLDENFIYGALAAAGAEVEDESDFVDDVLEAFAKMPNSADDDDGQARYELMTEAVKKIITEQAQ